MTQHELVIEYVKFNGSILPAKMSGKVWNDHMFGSAIDMRCRELRKDGVLTSTRDGRFTRFYLAEEFKK